MLYPKVEVGFLGQSVPGSSAKVALGTQGAYTL